MNQFPSMSMMNAGLLETLYDAYCERPGDVDKSWQEVFAKVDACPPKERTRPASLKTEESCDLSVFDIIEAYRTYGHLIAPLNPIAKEASSELPYELCLSTYGFTVADLDKQVPTGGFLSVPHAPLREVIAVLREIYCGKIGIEYMSLGNPELEKWLQGVIEPSRLVVRQTIDQKRMILNYLNMSELFEIFIHTKYAGQKRFSLEGGETLVPLLAALIEKSSALGVREFVVGMAHRGRLNVLSNIMRKSYADIFSEFEEGYIPSSFGGSGDVKYHKGFSSVITTADGKKVKVDLMPNPSHLEAVDPVVEGQARARLVINNDLEKKETVLPVLIHGDAALAGQGIVYETLQLYRLEGYSTGGTVHIVINNQIGFTTLPRDSRSTHYCTDIAKTFSAPVFHVNAEDPESCCYAIELAAEMRHRFACDVFIDMVCYRKYGHNETDEPAYTQPIDYRLIKGKKPIREIYRDDLIHQGVVEKRMAEALEQDFKADLQKALERAQEPEKIVPQNKVAKRRSYVNRTQIFQRIETGVPQNLLIQIGKKVCTVPSGLEIHKKLEKLLADRLAMVEAAKPIDWGMAELLAYGSLLFEGTHVRLSGQDSCRGTFSHRHALWMDQKTEKPYIPLRHLKEGQGRFDVYNSSLSEYGVLGFEFGYSLALPEALVIWEAQFGDFCNGAQVMIDQFIATGEQKWGQKQSIVLFLPHGYEGQGPEHSSARMERFLTLCGDDNLLVVNPSTPAQFFHVLRRQVLRKNKKPLIVFTPKALLRHPDCTSSLEDLTLGTFHELLDDPIKPQNATRAALCSGHIYYDLLDARQKLSVSDIAIIRVEQLYPFYKDRLMEILKTYPLLKECYWVQEEPRNMGAWTFVHQKLHHHMPEGISLSYIGRMKSASPAAGSYALHRLEHQELLDALFGKK